VDHSVEWTTSSSEKGRNQVKSPKSPQPHTQKSYSQVTIPALDNKLASAWGGIL